MDNVVLMEIESLRRATLAALRKKYREVFGEETRSRHREHLFRRIAWRVQALAEGNLSERAKGRACEIARDADLRIIAPADFFTVEGERVRTTRGNRNRREQDSRLPLPGAVLRRQWKGRHHSGRSPREGIPVRDAALLLAQRDSRCDHGHALERPRFLRAYASRGPGPEGAAQCGKIIR